ncbi:GNAT family N-acetyltransferase [Acinetobacter puyangensis]|uniref:N-acetyltransferase domain-containing protein n=1 Tax=Acinetobacter puyangensis TaxID=1096779 RepID=A0A240E6T5_9GAMM|nr:GNAT family N-acetyltransferase [Acinetobacter puyangensis]SNX44286.1 hypothetical protein SAMN05421731_10320 [Acinetobacter puyangensis]
MKMLEIKELSTIRFEQWLALWKAYLAFYHATFQQEIAEFTWHRLIASNKDNMYGFAAIDGDQVVGIVHVIEHDSCWTQQPYAYLQDLYVITDVRGQGVGRALIEQVYRVTAERGCDRVVWLTQESNLTAQRLYDNIAVKTGFIQYKKALQDMN